MPLKAGARRDRDVVRATRDLASRLFRDRGYPQAIVDASERPGANATSVIVTYRAESGPQMAFGPVKVQGLETLLEKNIVRELAFKPGELFDERKVARSQRQLSALELLEVAVVTPRFDVPDGNKVPMTVTVTEGKPRLLRFGLGYGTEERARATINWQHLNFYGGAKQATVDAKWSGIERGIELALIDPYAWRAVCRRESPPRRGKPTSSPTIRGRTAAATASRSRPSAPRRLAVHPSAIVRMSRTPTSASATASGRSSWPTSHAATSASRSASILTPDARRADWPGSRSIWRRHALD
jgi:hypothetical protein